jgi:shikimate dehydrogenase
MSVNKFLEITAKTKVLAVIGDPIEHSMSPTMHNAAINALNLDYIYVAYHVKPDHLQAACNGFRALNIQGINVTIPHKVNVMQFLDEIDPIAKGIGAVNTIKNENGKLIGRNTDGEGMLLALLNAGFDPSQKKCILIGSGGAARAISYILSTKAKEVCVSDLYPEVAERLRGNLISFYSQENILQKLKLSQPPIIRTIPLTEESFKRELYDADLLVNCSPIGMHPDYENRSPLDNMNVTLHPGLFVFDAVYNPMDTKLLQSAKSQGCSTLGGIHMLVNQGAIAFEWWTGFKPDYTLMTEAAIMKLNIKK